MQRCGMAGRGTSRRARTRCALVPAVRPHHERRSRHAWWGRFCTRGRPRAIQVSTICPDCRGSTAG